MGALFSLLFSFTGRVNRARWWIGFAIILISSLIGIYLLNPEQFAAAEPPPPNWAETIWALGWLVPMTAITVKRFNDRDWPWWLGYAVAAVTVVSYVAPHFRLMVDPLAGGLGAVIFWFTAAVGFLALVDNGFVRGTDGPNRYGPDPLARGAAPA